MSLRFGQKQKINRCKQMVLVHTAIISHEYKQSSPKHGFHLVQGDYRALWTALLCIEIVNTNSALRW